MLVSVSGEGVYKYLSISRSALYYTTIPPYIPKGKRYYIMQIWAFLSRRSRK
jgi:hypothetical protein